METGEGEVILLAEVTGVPSFAENILLLLAIGLFSTTWPWLLFGVGVVIVAVFLTLVFYRISSKGPDPID